LYFKVESRSTQIFIILSMGGGSSFLGSTTWALIFLLFLLLC